MTRHKILILTGPPAVGKTSISKVWAIKNKGARVECDPFTNWIYDPQFPHWTLIEEEMNAEISIRISEIYHRKSLDVCIDNVWKKEGINIILNHFASRSDVDILTVCLTCSAEVNVQRDNQRIEAHRMGARIQVLRDELREVTQYVDLVIDTTDKAIEDIVDFIDSKWSL